MTQQNEELYELLACLTVTIGAVELIANDSGGHKDIYQSIKEWNEDVEQTLKEIENDN